MLPIISSAHFFSRRMTRFLATFLLFALLLPSVPVQADNVASALSFHHVGVVEAKGASLHNQPKTSAQKISQIEKGDKCEIIGETGKFYRVRHQNQIGYISREKIKIRGEQLSVNLPETLCDTVKLEDPIPLLNSKYLVLKGIIQTDQPLDTLYAYLWDERTFRLEAAYIKSLSAPSKRIDTSTLKTFLPISNVMGGRKTLILEGSLNGEMSVLFRSMVYIRGLANEPAHVTHMCSGLPPAVLDTKVSTAWSPTKKQPGLTVNIPPNAKATILTWEWKTPPDTVTVQLLDASGAVLLSEKRSHRFYADWVSLPPEARQAVIMPQGAGCALATLRVYTEPYSHHAVQQWQDIPDKIDMLVISTHQDDEFLFLGGTIPYYAQRDDVNIAVLYMTYARRVRYREALDGLWTAGLKYHPITLGLEDFYTMNVGLAHSKWKRNDPLGMLVRFVRQYKPEVIVCQDLNGEYGHAQHKVTAQLVTESIAQAARDDYDPNSLSAWGAWQVKKLYIHLYEKNQIKMDWNMPLEDSGVITPLFLATEGFDKHRSQQSAFSMRRHGVEYDNTLFGLYYTAVGPDKKQNDFMENIR